MTVTETPPEAASPSTESSGAVVPGDASPAPGGGLASILGTGDHKVIGRLYIAFSLLFGLVALVAGLVVSIDRIDGTFGNTILTDGTWNQVTTFQTTALVFMLLMPLVLGIAICVVPLQVGADGIAFPRAAAASFWAWLLGSGAFVAAYAINGGPGGGDFNGVGLWAASFVMVVAALLLGAVCVVCTIFALRAEGMSLDRTPMFAWSMLVTGVVWVLSLPVLIGTLALIYVDHRYGQKSFGFNGPEMFTRVSWAFRQPQVYALATPLLGLVAEVVPVAAGSRQPRRLVAMGAIGGFGVLGFGAFLQPTIYPRATVQPVYVAMSILAVLPVLAFLGVLASCLKSGRPRLISPLGFSLFALLLLLMATLGGAASSIQRLNLQGTQFDLGQTNLVVFAALTSAVGGLFWWATKVSGRALSEGLGSLTAGVLVLGTLLIGVPYAISGAFANGREARTGIEGLNVVGAAGYGLVLVGLLLVLLALLGSLRGTATATGDPWDGHTLEWATTSPPPYENFTEPPVVRSAEPLLDEQRSGSDTEEVSA